MNILVFSWRGPKHPLAGGAEQVMHEHMKGWIAAGHRVVLFTSYFQGSLKKERLDGVEIIRKGNQILEVHLAAFFWYVLGKHEKFDLVIDQFHGIPFFTPFYVRISKLAVLQEVARKVWLKNDLPTPFNRIVGTVGYLSEPLIFLFYKKIFFMTGSQSAKTDLVSMGISSNKIVIVPHGVVVEKPRSTPKKEKKETIMFLGALAKDKGIEDALKVFSILNKKGSFQFWIVGRAGKPYLKYLKSLVKKLGLGKAIKFFGFVSQKRKFELLARTHILINPSILEGFGLVNIEANAMGTPVVAYKSRGLIDSVKHNRSGILCQKNTPESMADEVFNLLNSPKKLKQFKKKTVNWSKNFSWKKSAKLSLDLIEKIVENYERI